ncbi:MAG: NADH-quinone oxidoreductase subunit N [Candidatus Sumerlaeaceae bacterium]|nr:NADH-quinone oxidoreductase subunit N [Candidatus Sumerlaeaceae bacterium]
MSEILALMPEILLSVGGTVILLIAATAQNANMRDFVRWLALFISLGAGFSLYTMSQESMAVTSNGWLHTTPLGVAFGVIFMLILAWTCVAGSVPESDGGEWYGLLLLAGLGMLTLARTANLGGLFLGIEILSISLYVLIAFAYDRKLSLRAGAMYLLLAGFASSFLIFGLALIYVQYGTIQIAELSKAFEASMGQAGDGKLPLIATLGFALFIVGVAFKLSVVPFHMWAAEVYEAAPGAISGLIASASKGATIAAFLPFLFIVQKYGQVLWILAAASMVGGNLLGLRETRVKRILAYSSIAHVGYLMVGYLAGQAGVGVTGQSSVIFYVAAYALSILGAFVCISLLERESTLSLRDLKGVARQSPVVAFCLLVFVASLAGIPPAIGFVGKFLLFNAGIGAKYYWLAGIGLLGSAIGIYYYLRIIVYLFMMPTEATDVQVRHTPLQSAMLVASAATVVILGCAPQLVFDFLRF